MRSEQVQRRILGQTADVAAPAPRPLPKQRTTPLPPRMVKRDERLLYTEDLPESRHQKSSILLPLGGGMCGALFLLIFLVSVVLPWWNSLQNQWHYGDSHVSHFDYHGHHFIGDVYRGYVTVFDIPENHPEKSRVFLLQSATDNAVVRFEIRDTNNDGIPDVTVGTEGSPIGTTLYGTKDNAFSKTPPEGK